MYPQSSWEGAEGILAFSGIPHEAVEFLGDLARHNDEAWFREHRAAYERVLVEPLRALVREFADWMLDVDPGMEVRPQVGRAISRIRRDTRFSRDKRPYRDVVWIAFWNRRLPTEARPGFFWELTVEHYRYGMGYYSASRRVMDAVRRAALDAPDRFRAVVAPVETWPAFAVRGERYRRTVMPGAPADLAAWLDRKSLHVEAAHPHDEVLFGSALADRLWAAWERLIPLYQFLRTTGEGVIP